MTKRKPKAPPVEAVAAGAPVDVPTLKALLQEIEAAQGVKGRQAALVGRLVAQGAERTVDAATGTVSLSCLGVTATRCLGNAELLANLANAARRAILRAEVG